MKNTNSGDKQLLVKNFTNGEKVMFVRKIFLISICFILQRSICKAQSQLPIKEFLVNSTVLIVGSFDSVINGQKQHVTVSGTGFFFTFSIDTSIADVIVTNAHVIKNLDTCSLYFNFLKPNGQPDYGNIITYVLTGKSIKDIIIHPTADLAVIPFGGIETLIKNKYGKDISGASFSEENLLPDSLAHNISAIEDILMIGYPYGLRDNINNVPIVRKGLTATPYFLNYNGQKLFLMDIPNFPGSSGSPILYYSEGEFISGRAMEVGTKLYLLGINCQYLLHDSTPINIGIAIKASELLYFKSVINKLLK